MTKRIQHAGLAIVLLTIVTGVICEQAFRLWAASEFPAPGKLVNIGGRRMQIDCRGTGSPTVVFEAGLDLNGSLSWSAVHDEVAKTTRACAYSRAGIMWSDASDGPQSATNVAEDLYVTLHMAGEKPPFVLAGHSLGGPYIMTFAKLFGRDVVGLVFVDASHPDQVQRFKSVMAHSSSTMTMMIKAGAMFAWTGAVRMVPMASRGAPHQPDLAVQAMAAYAPTSLEALAKEYEALDQTLAEAGTARQLGDRPIYILTAMAPYSAEVLAALGLTAEQGRQYKGVWKGMHDDATSWSSRSHHRLVPDADHYIQYDRPDIVVDALRSVVYEVRAKR